MLYKVWIEIEALDDRGDPVEDVIGDLPDCVGEFSTYEEALARQAEITSTFGVDPENSDAVKAAERLENTLDGSLDAPPSALSPEDDPDQESQWH